MHKQRIFLAIYPDDKTKTELYNFKTAYNHLTIHWVNINNIHMTLCFIGWIKDKKLEQVIYSSQQVRERHSKFNIKLLQISSEKERIIWARAELNRNLYNLHSDLSANLGLDIHKFFIPHITLARGKRIPRIQQNINLAFIAKSINIVESKLYRTGPEYSIIKTIPLL